MKQSRYLNPSEETRTGCHVTSKYGRTPPNKHEGVGLQQQVGMAASFSKETGGSTNSVLANY